MENDYWKLLQENNDLRLQVLELESKIENLELKIKCAKEWLK